MALPLFPAAAAAENLQYREEQSIRKEASSLKY
jgi:hypothetical protein